jgi:hypothetical protein
MERKVSMNELGGVQIGAAFGKNENKREQTRKEY